MDFDEDRIYYSHQNLQAERRDAREKRVDDADVDDDDVDLKAVRRHFREFLRNYRQKQKYVYRTKLLQMHQLTKSDSGSIEVDLAHVGEYDPALLGLLLSQPANVMPPFEVAASDALKTLLFEQQNSHDTTTEQLADAQQQQQENSPTAEEDTIMASSFGEASIQIFIRGNLTSTPLRSIQSQHMNTLIRCPGIVISAARVQSRPNALHITCSRCGDSRTLYATSGPFGGIPLPQRCVKGGPDCGPTPYAVDPDQCLFVDQQTLKLQEAPERVPTGEMPRSVLMAVERELVDRAPPGTRVHVWAIASLFNAASSSRAGGGTVKTVYLRVVGMHADSGSPDNVSFTPREEEAFRLLSRRPNIYDILSRSFAPSISGAYTVNIKKALTCMLFGGSRKRLPDGMRLRGDINVLLLGDPSMAKSQFLKYTTRVAPVGIYTSGKGSSAAGLTASVVRDQRGEFYLEGGAMVLADGGIVAIDEFDKMRPSDRVAIHEAMEQQTISVAKAGITTVLNSRASVLAAANPVFGRYDDLKSASENIDLMTTILSRFDLIFLLRDVRNEELDKLICRHVMGVHINSSRGAGGNNNGVGGDGIFGGSALNGNDEEGNGIDGDFIEDITGFGNGDGPSSSNSSPEAIAENAMRVATTGVGELDVPTMKKYIQYCRTKCSPRLSEEAGDVLASSYVKIRDDVRRKEMESSGNNSDKNNEHVSNNAVIPITVRQLEALVRLSESLAKMRLENEVQAEDVAEALRLFKVSTMAANAAEKGAATSNPLSLNGPSSSSREEMQRTESFLRSRLGIGTVVNKQRIVEEACSQGYNAMSVVKAIAVMVMRGEIQERNTGRMIKRIK